MTKELELTVELNDRMYYRQTSDSYEARFDREAAMNFNLQTHFRTYVNYFYKYGYQLRYLTQKFNNYKINLN